MKLAVVSTKNIKQTRQHMQKPGVGRQEAIVPVKHRTHVLSTRH